MTAPTFVGEATETTHTSSASAKTTGSISVTTGDILVAWCGQENAANTISISASTTQSWTEGKSASTGIAEPRTYIWTATANFTGSLTVTFTPGGTHAFGGSLLVFSGSDGVGTIQVAYNTTNDNGTPTISVTTAQANSAVVVASVDWNANDGASRTWSTVNSITPTSGNGYETTYYRNASTHASYAAYYPDAGTAAAKTVGIATPSGVQRYSVAAVEVKGGTGAGATTTAPSAGFTAAATAKGDIYVVGAGAQVVTNTAAANLTPALPTGWAVGDLHLLVIAGRPTANTALTATSGWTQAGTYRIYNTTNLTTYFLSAEVWYRVAESGDTAPTVATNTAYANGGTVAGVSAQILGIRGQDTTTPFDGVTFVTSSGGNGSSTFTPTGVTTATDKAMVVSIVASADDNALNLNTANSFTLSTISGASYDTTTGSDHAVGVATYVKPTAGAVTMPVWNESAVGPDSWAAITLSVRPLPSTVDGNITTTAPAATLAAAATASSAVNGATTTTAPAATLAAAATASVSDSVTTTAPAATLAAAATASVSDGITTTAPAATLAAAATASSSAGITTTAPAATLAAAATASSTGAVTTTAPAATLTANATASAGSPGNVTTTAPAATLAAAATASSTGAVTTTAPQVSLAATATAGAASPGAVTTTAPAATLTAAATASGSDSITTTAPAATLAAAATASSTGAVTTTAPAATLAAAATATGTSGAGITTTAPAATLSAAATASSSGAVTTTAPAATLAATATAAAGSAVTTTAPQVTVTTGTAGASGGISAGVTTTAPSVALDAAATASSSRTVTTTAPQVSMAATATASSSRTVTLTAPAVALLAAATAGGTIGANVTTTAPQVLVGVGASTPVYQFNSRPVTARRPDWSRGVRRPDWTVRSRRPRGDGDAHRP